MAWKPKEKPLTPEEAVALARRELAPFWHGSEPLLAAIREGTKTTVYPLDAGFPKKPCLLLMLDPTDHSGLSLLCYSKEWFKRYRAHEFGVVGVMRPVFRFMRSPGYLETLARKHQIPHALALDANGGITDSFVSGAGFPRAILLHQGRRVFELDGTEWHAQGEQAIHDFLRKKDPGLPLLPIFRPTEPLPVERGRTDLGSWKGFPAPGFVKGPDLMTGIFPKRPRPKSIRPGEIFICGKWVSDGERILTTDPEAVLGFRCSSPWFALVAAAVSKTSEFAEIVVEAGDVPAHDEIRSEEIVMNDSGDSVVRVSEPRFYPVLDALPAGGQEITLRFPSADRVPVAIYGFRSGG